MIPQVSLYPAAAQSPAARHDLHAKAFARRPDAPIFRLRLARSLFQDDRFDEVIQLLDGQSGWSERYLWTLSQLARPDAVSAAAAETGLRELLTQAVAAHDRAMALSLMGKLLRRQGRHAEALPLHLEAYALSPAHPDIMKRLTACELALGLEAKTLARCDAALASGQASSRLLSDRYLALLLLGRPEEAEQTLGLDDLLIDQPLDTLLADGEWTAEDRLASRDELSTHPSLRFTRYGAASIASWRIDEPYTTRSVMVARILDVLVKAIQQVLSVHADQPVVRALPDRLRLKSWSVQTTGPGYESWHMHQNGLLSGVYYVDVPSRIASGVDEQGCIAFGPPELDFIPRVFPGGQRLIRPAAGKLLLFPSQAFHRTFTYTGEGARVVLAFDLGMA